MRLKLIDRPLVNQFAVQRFEHSGTDPKAYGKAVAISGSGREIRTLLKISAELDNGVLLVE